MLEINYDNFFQKRIVTFGSCLSRYTANQYTYLFGGSVVSSVFHNRSDLFVKKFLNESKDKTKFEELERILPNMSEIQAAILKNQILDSIGLHNLSRGISFFDAINQQPDYLFLDNYIDVVGKVAVLENGKEFFHKVTIDSNVTLSELLDIDISIQNFTKIVKFAREITPRTKIVFITFPGDGYPEDNIRKKRFDDFRENFFSRNVDMIIRSKITNRKYLTSEKMHFKTSFYSSLAGMIFANLG